MNQTLSLYHIFNAVAEYGNISKAAKELYISQPAISKAISRLEKGLNTVLFIRSSRGVTLTDAGKLLYEHTSAAFNQIEQGEERLKRNLQLGTGHIKIGVSTTLCRYLLLPYLQAFIKQYPHMKISISCQSTYETINLLDSHKVDIGLIGKPSHQNTLAFDQVTEIEDSFVSTREYIKNLIKREPEARNSLFLYANLMLLNEENISRHFINSYLHNEGIETGQILEVSSMDLLIEFARIGMGIACVIKEFVTEDLETGRLLELPLAHKIKRREVGFAYKKDRPLSDSILKFIEFYRKFSASSLQN